MFRLFDFFLSLKRIDLRVWFVGISKEILDEFRHQSTEYNGCEADHDQSRTLDDRYLILVFICALNGQDQGKGNRSSDGSCN